jgi:hypothetical protein
MLSARIALASSLREDILTPDRTVKGHALDDSAFWATPEKSANNVTQAASHVHGAFFCVLRNLWIMLACCAISSLAPVDIPYT